MDHRYIDEYGVAERYLEHSLASREHEAFEAHVVDCQECADRLLLAQIFLERKGAITTSEPMPKRAQFVAGFTPWQLLLLAAAAALLLLAVPTAYFAFELARLSGRR